MHVLVNDDQGRLALRRLRLWQRVLAHGAAGNLDRALAAGASPESNARLAARAVRLTSTEFRRDLAASLRRILVAAGEPTLPARARVLLGVGRPVPLPLQARSIGQNAPLLAELAGRLLEPGPVPVRGVAMVADLLTDGTGPLYRDAAARDLTVLARRAADALIW
jgi:hypothetical protein